MLRVDPAKLKASTVESGYANLEIVSAVGGMWFFSYETGSPTAPITVNLDAKSKLPCGLNPEGQPYNFTGFMLERKRDPAWAVVGQGYILQQKDTVGDFMKFLYTKGASHEQATELGVAVSGHGFDAGYQKDGTHTSTVKRSESYGNEGKSTWFQTEFKTGQFRDICYGNPNDNTVPHQKQKKCPRSFKNEQNVVFYVHKCFWMIQSTGWFGGQNAVHPKTAFKTPAKYCAQHQKGDTFGSDFGKAIEWSGGFDLGASLGIKGSDLKTSYSGSAQTGYDANAVMEFHFKHFGYLCGTNGSESSAALLVQRDNRP